MTSSSSGVRRPAPTPALQRVALLVALRGFGVLQSREALIRELAARGWTVLVYANRDSAAVALDGIAGVEFIHAGFGRRAIAPLADARAVFRLAKLLKGRRPALIHMFNAKPTLLGLMAVRKAGCDAVIVNTVTGLGHAFATSRLLRFISGALYRRLLLSAHRTIFQNPDDMELFQREGYVDSRRAELIVGSGVDTGRYRPSAVAAPAARACTVLMAARLLRSKGVLDYLDAARQLRASPNTRFLLAGEAEPKHPDGIDEAVLRRNAQDAGVEYLGYRSDLDQLLPQVDMVVLPSYYREGVPRVLVEAAACGVAVVTTDSPGCREAVEEGVTGLLVPVRDPTALAQAMDALLRDRARLRLMGTAARERAVQRFDIRGITDRHLSIYDGLLGQGGRA